MYQSMLIMHIVKMDYSCLNLVLYFWQRDWIYVC